MSSHIYSFTHAVYGSFQISTRELSMDNKRPYGLKGKPIYYLAFTETQEKLGF